MFSHKPGGTRLPAMHNKCCKSRKEGYSAGFKGKAGPDSSAAQGRKGKGGYRAQPTHQLLAKTAQPG
jgi:hypothetical protein